MTLKDKCVLITGVSGSFGRKFVELAARSQRHWPAVHSVALGIQSAITPKSNFLSSQTSACDHGGQ
jgi:NAD(P)-dependent dehydrogenase (short-subunit alcohol dehydrogenase family)